MQIAGTLHIIFDVEDLFVPAAGMEWEIIDYVNRGKDAGPTESRGVFGTFSSVTSESTHPSS